MGKPIICTPVGAHKDVIQDGINGFIVQPGDIDMIAKKILYILQNPRTRESMAKTNYQYVRNRFHINLIAKQLEEYIEEVISTID